MTTFNERIKKISIDSIIDGFSYYYRTSKRILSHPFGLPEEIDLDDKSKDQLWAALGYLNYAIILDFVLLIPLLIYFEEKVSKLTFLIWCLVLYFSFGVLLHFSLRFVGSVRARLTATYTVYFYIAGFISPLGMLILYPTILLLGPSALPLFGKPNVEMGPIAVNQLGVLVCIIALQIIFIIIIYTISISWFSQSHRIGKSKVCLGLILFNFIGWLLMSNIDPYLKTLFFYMDKVFTHL